jgi:hypothetical protein
MAVAVAVVRVAIVDRQFQRVNLLVLVVAPSIQPMSVYSSIRIMCPQISSEQSVAQAPEAKFRWGGQPAVAAARKLLANPALLQTATELAIPECCQVQLIAVYITTTELAAKAAPAFSI